MILQLMFIMHFIADFLLQSREVAENKSNSLKHLFIHISIIFTMFIPFGLLFALLNALIHMIIDACIWRIYKVTYIRRGVTEFYKDAWFYNFIGFDQLLHGLTLIVLWSIFYENY